jgi:hypothetical protein
MLEDISFGMVAVCSFIPVVGFMVINYDKIANYVIKSLYYSPGEGEIYKKGKNNFYIRNPEHDYRLNYIKTPSFDMSIHLFKKDIVVEDSSITFPDFVIKYGTEKTLRMENHYMGIIDDIYHTSNFKKGRVYGYIRSLTDDMIYIFVIEEGPIDFRKIFIDYEKEFNEYEI